MALFVYKSSIALFVVLLLLDFYLVALVFSAVNQDKFSKLRFLGPIALLFPGVLSRKGTYYLLGMIIVTTGLFVSGLYIFGPDVVP